MKRIHTRAFLVAFFSLSLAWTAFPAKGAQTAPKKPVTKKPAPAATPRPPIYDPLLSGKIALETTGKVCLDTNRKLFVNFGTNDCDLCYLVKAAIFEKDYFERFGKEYIAVFIDVAPGSENTQLLSSYGIDPAKGLPAVAVLDLVNRAADVTREGELAQAAQKGPAELKAFLERLLSTETKAP